MATMHTLLDIMEKLTRYNYSKYGGKFVKLKLKNGKELNVNIDFIFWEGEDEEDHQVITRYRAFMFNEIEGVEIIED